MLEENEKMKNRMEKNCITTGRHLHYMTSWAMVL